MLDGLRALSNTGHGVQFSGNTSMSAINCVLSRNGGSGLTANVPQAEQPITLRACDAHSNADDGINITNDAKVEQVTALSNIGISVTGALTDHHSANNQTA